jgi:hypothetical protein
MRQRPSQAATCLGGGKADSRVADQRLADKAAPSCHRAATAPRGRQTDRKTTATLRLRSLCGHRSHRTPANTGGRLSRKVQCSRGFRSCSPAFAGREGIGETGFEPATPPAPAGATSILDPPETVQRAATGSVLTCRFPRFLFPACSPSATFAARDLPKKCSFAGNSLVGETGFEPATARPPAGCATRLRHSPWLSKRATGIEPALEAWKASVQPQHFARSPRSILPARLGRHLPCLVRQADRRPGAAPVVARAVERDRRAAERATQL